MGPGMRNPHLLARALFIFVMAIALAIAATLLPDNPYQRYQLLDGTVYAKGKWMYQRVHFDPAPIDVAILGDSRTLIGLQPDRIAAQLAQAGKPVQVANLSLVGEGRNIQWVLARDVMRIKRPKVLILTLSSGASPWGHDTFRYFASASDIWREAQYGLYDARKNVMYLPFRQLKLLAAQVAPGVFGLEPAFDPATYNPAQDNWTTPRTSADGKFHDPQKLMTREELLEQFKKSPWEIGRHTAVPAPLRHITDADDRVYLDLIAAEARKRGIKVIFVAIPEFHRHDGIRNRRYYESIGPIQDNADIAEREDLYMDVNHTNAAGSQLVSDRVAAVVAPLLP